MKTYHDVVQAIAQASTPAQRGQLSREAVEQVQADLRQRYQAGQAAETILAAFSDRCDDLVRALFTAAFGAEAQMVCVVALGGYGRREMFPYSDLDLLILCEGRPAEQATQLVEELVYPLWDAKLAVGHALRTIDQTLELAQTDLSARTSLLDARIIAGDEGPFFALEAGAYREYFGPERVEAFVDSLHQERAERHKRFGATVYLLEPNVKNSRGGLRDLNTGLWAARSRFGVGTLRELLPLGHISERQVRVLEEAQSFLRGVRLAMHLDAGRGHDQLQFETQERLAPRLFPALPVPGGQRRTVSAVGPAVERLMHAFYRHARHVVIETDALLERCREAGHGNGQPGRKVSGDPDEHLEVASHRLRSIDPHRFWEHPADVLRAFQVLLSTGLGFEQATRDAIAEAVFDAPGRQLLADAEAIERWLDLLCRHESEADCSIMEELHHVGLVAAMIPEFEGCTGRIQHDLYHVYTVDLHSLYVLRLLKLWRRGDGTEVSANGPSAMSRVRTPRALFLAGLLHDVGKPLGKGHSEKGARLSVGVAARLGFDAAEQAAVEFLVAQHVTMAHISQRRDLSDPQVIAAFVAQVGSVEGLRQLYLLTLADTAMTAPGNLTEWKAALLEDLYMKSYLQLTRGDREAVETRAKRLRRHRGELSQVIGELHGTAATELVRGMPDEMLLAHEVEDLARYASSIHALLNATADPPVVLTARPLDAATELVVCCPDAQGLLSLITGVFVLHGVDVLAAQVYTIFEPPRAFDAKAPIAADIFVLRKDEEELPVEKLRADLAAGLRGELDLERLVQQRTAPRRTTKKVRPEVAIEIAVDPRASAHFTVIDVQAPDHLGVLHAITKSLSEIGVTIHLAKVATEVDRVIDTFYVKDRTNSAKIVDDGRLKLIKEHLAAAISSLGGS